MLISVTRLRLRSWRFLLPFLWWARRSERQARAAEGNLDVAVVGERDLTFWTKSAWRDAAAMRAYMIGGDHGRVMPRLMEWCDEAAVVHYETGDARLPSWAEAHRRLVVEGRPSKLRHPSRAHLASDIRAPRV